MLTLSNWLENEALLVRHAEFFQKSQVLVAESCSGMVPLLILDIANDLRNLRMRIRKGAKSFLPGKTSQDPSPSIDECGRGLFDVMDQVGKGYASLLADEEMGMVRHTMDRQEFLSAMRDDPGDIFVQLLFEFGSNETLSSFHRENDLDIDLRVSICHEADVGKFVVGRANKFQDGANPV